MIINDKSVLLIAEDNEDDYILTRDALEDIDAPVQIFRVCDGVELLEFLANNKKFAGGGNPKPDVILLDLNMPRMNGLEALGKLKSDENFKNIPVIVLSTSSLDDDVFAVYNLGGNSYINKRRLYDDNVEALRAMCDFWFRVALLPK